MQAFDPVVKALPPALRRSVSLCETAVQALDQAEALIVETPCPEFRLVSADQLIPEMKNPLIIDPHQYLGATLGGNARIRYATIGRPAPGP